MDVSVSADLFDEDVVGSILPSLSIADVVSLLLSCKAFNTAIKRQLRILSPLYLPDTTAIVWNSLESLHLGLSRSSTNSHGKQEAHVSPFTWLAPIRSFITLAGFQHAAQVDLSGQQLPADAIQLLSRHLTRLRAFQLDGCKLPMASMLDVTGLTTLRSLSVSGIQLTGSLPPAGQPEHAASEAQHEVTVNSGTRVPTVISQQQAARLLDAICQLQLQELRMDLRGNTRDPFGLPHVSPFVSTHGIPVLNSASKLSALSSLRVLSLVNNILDQHDWDIICNSIGPGLKELHITWGSKDPKIRETLSLNPDVFSHISRLTSLDTLTLEMTHCLKFDPYTLAPVAKTLTELTLRGPVSIPLGLSLTECSKVVRLELSGLGEAALNELLLQVLSSMPMLQSLSVSRLQPPNTGQVGLQPTGDCLLSHLDTCCPHLTELWMPDILLNGTGLRLVASGAAEALREVDTPAAGGVRSCHHMDLFTMHMMRSAYPHLSALTGLQSLTLHGMAQKQFPQLCKLGCLNSLTALTNLSSLRMLPVLDELAQQERRLHAQHDAAAVGAAINAAVAAAPEAPLAGPAAAAGAAMAAAVAAEQQLMDAVMQMEPAMGNVEDGDIESSEDQDSDSGMEDEEFHSEGGEEDPQQQHQQQIEWVHPEEPDHEEPDFPEEDPEPDQEQLEAAQQAANQAVQALAQELQNQADILANNPAQQILAGGAFQQVAQMLLPNGMVGNLAGPGAAAAQAAVAAVQAAAVQLAQNAAPGPEGAGAIAALQNALQAVAAAGGGAQQQQQQVPAIPYAGMYGLRRHPFEPHLHFLDSMTGLVNLELSCLQTTGLCFLHLSNLQSLQSLVLGGIITLNEQSWGYLAGLHLPGVTTLSLTGCTVTAAKASARNELSTRAGTSPAADSSSGTAGSLAAATNTLVGANNSSAAVASSASRKGHHTTGFGSGAMGSFVRAVCFSFPGVVNLELGSCRSMTKGLLVHLVRGLRRLERLRLLGVPGAALYTTHPERGAAAVASGSESDCRQRQQQPTKVQSNPGGTRRPLLTGARAHLETQSAIHWLSSLAQRGEAALALKYIEICESEISRCVLGVAHGVQDVARFHGGGKSVFFVRHNRQLKPCQP